MAREAQPSLSTCECGHPKALHLAAGECPYRRGFFKEVDLAADLDAIHEAAAKIPPEVDVLAEMYRECPR